jgi:hypothetical protein
MILNDPVLNSQIKNKGFAILDSIFKQHQWHLIKNELNWICYTKFGIETNSFDIKILPDKIIVSVPIKNSCYQYVTNFKSYFEASEYIEQKFFDYIN